MTAVEETIEHTHDADAGQQEPPLPLPDYSDDTGTMLRVLNLLRAQEAS